MVNPRRLRDKRVDTCFLLSQSAGRERKTLWITISRRNRLKQSTLLSILKHGAISTNEIWITS